MITPGFTYTPRSQSNMGLSEPDSQATLTIGKEYPWRTGSSGSGPLDLSAERLFSLTLDRGMEYGRRWNPFYFGKDMTDQS